MVSGMLDWEMRLLLSNSKEAVSSSRHTREQCKGVCSPYILEELPGVV